MDAPIQTVISWPRMLQQNLLCLDRFSKDIPLTSTPFKARIFCTVHSKSRHTPGIHVFFGTQLPHHTQHTLFWGFIPKYFNCTSEYPNPDCTAAQHMQWGSLHSLRKYPQQRTRSLTLIEHHAALKPPPQNYKLPPQLGQPLTPP